MASSWAKMALATGRHRNNRLARAIDRIAEKEASMASDRETMPERIWAFIRVECESAWSDRPNGGTEYVLATTHQRTLEALREAERGRGIYIASKAVHGPRWRSLRASGVDIISTWIDEAEQGETSDWPDLWARCVREASECAALLLYCEPGEVLKGAWVEAGAALARGRPVFAVGIDAFSVRHHPLVHQVPTIDAALARIKEATDAGT